MSPKKVDSLHRNAGHFALVILLFCGWNFIEKTENNAESTGVPFFSTVTKKKASFI